MTPRSDESLAHFGVKGMRWGVRRDPGRGVVVRNNPYQSRHQEARSMSNQELQNRIARANLERQYLALEPQSASKRIANKFKTSFEDQLIKKGASIAVNSAFLGADFAFNKLKDPSSVAFTKKGESIYNVWSQIRPK